MAAKKMIVGKPGNKKDEMLREGALAVTATAGPYSSSFTMYDVGHHEIYTALVDDILDQDQCVKQSFRVSYQPLNLGGVEGGSAQRPPEALRRSRNFFFSYLVAISFPIEFDVWGRLCTH